MRVAHRTRLLGAVVFGTLTVAPPLAAQEPEVWITLHRHTALALQEELGRRGKSSDFTLDLDAEIVVGRLKEAQVELLGRIVHQRFNRCGGFLVHASQEAALQESQRNWRAESFEAALVSYTIDNGAVVNAMLPNLKEASIRDTISNLAAFHTRYYTTQTGVNAAHWLRDRWQSYAAGRSDVSVSLFNHSWAQPSVIMTITGTTLPNEVVVVGGHLDSINGGGVNRAPGADDDASGVATFTEVARVALSMGYRPQRTVKFMAYAAEEVGLRGSQEIANQHKNTGVNVVGVLQLDMTNYKGSSADIVIITDRTNAAQNTFVRNLVDTYLGLPRADSQCGYGCSDHASWTNAGFAASFPFEALFNQHNRTIHTANDTLAQSGNNANHALKFAKLTAAYVAELAKGNMSGGGGGTTVFFDDFETNKGWTRNPNNTDTATAGLWERGDPEATSSGGAKQLGTTVSGVNDLVTGRLAGSSAGTHDIDGGVTSIQSPAIALPSSGTLTLSFSYYLAHATNSSSADYLRVYVVGSSTTKVFEELGAADNDNGSWSSTSVNLGSFAGQTVRIRIEAADAAGASLVEAAVDDVRITQQ